jgi:hypothetical protein
MDRFQSKKHNPHAHVIHQPGRRLMRGVRLPTARGSLAPEVGLQRLGLRSIAQSRKS